MWIEILGKLLSMPLIMSRPARALWIEISKGVDMKSGEIVEAREGLVD